MSVSMAFYSESAVLAHFLAALLNTLSDKFILGEDVVWEKILLLLAATVDSGFMCSFHLNDDWYAVWNVPKPGTRRFADCREGEENILPRGLHSTALLLGNRKCDPSGPKCDVNDEFFIKFAASFVLGDSPSPGTRRLWTPFGGYEGDNYQQWRRTCAEKAHRFARENDLLLADWHYHMLCSGNIADLKLWYGFIENGIRGFICMDDGLLRNELAMRIFKHLDVEVIVIPS